MRSGSFCMRVAVNIQIYNKFRLIVRLAVPMPVLLERRVVRLRQKIRGVQKAVLSPKFMRITDASGNPLDFF